MEVVYYLTVWIIFYGIDAYIDLFIYYLYPTLKHVKIVHFGTQILTSDYDKIYFLQIPRKAVLMVVCDPFAGLNSTHGCGLEHLNHITVEKKKVFILIYIILMLLDGRQRKSPLLFLRGCILFLQIRPSKTTCTAKNANMHCLRLANCRFWSCKF